MRRTRTYGIMTVLVLTAVAGTGCGVSSEVSDSGSKEACTQYAMAFNEGTDRETITQGIEEARAIAASTDDAEAERLAEAIDQVLTLSIVGTNETFIAANDEVLRLCREAGVTISVE